MLSVEEYVEALQAIPPDVCREEWVQVGMAARAAGLSEDDFLHWSEPAASFNERDVKAVWHSFSDSGGVSAGTLVHKAKQYGWEPQKHSFSAKELWDAGSQATDAHPCWRALKTDQLCSLKIDQG